jgi:DNA-binding MarR family transcriptional regulator
VTARDRAPTSGPAHASDAVAQAAGTVRPEPLEPSHWQSLHRLLADMDDQIAELYRRRGITEVRPRFVGPLILLARHRSLTIRELAELTGRTHSAASQTVAALRQQGLAESAPGDDARTRRVSLTGRGRELVPLMEAEWHATEEAVRQIEREIPYPLTRVVDDIRAVLGRRGFTDRVEDQLPSEFRTS